MTHRQSSKKTWTLRRWCLLGKNFWLSKKLHVINRSLKGTGCRMQQQARIVCLWCRNWFMLFNLQRRRVTQTITTTCLTPEPKARIRSIDTFFKFRSQFLSRLIRRFVFIFRITLKWLNQPLKSKKRKSKASKSRFRDPEYLKKLAEIWKPQTQLWDKPIPKSKPYIVKLICLNFENIKI